MKDIIDFIVTNKYVIICVTIVVFLYAIGVIQFLTKFIILILLIGLAIYVGKKLQENDNFLKNVFNFKGYKKNGNVYYYDESDKK
ncbi:MAG: hypothetical protein RSE41_06205 [Clostridia bacterium]